MAVQLFRLQCIFSVWFNLLFLHHPAGVAKLVDALRSGRSGGNPMEVQVLSSAPTSLRGDDEEAESKGTLSAHICII